MALPEVGLTAVIDNLNKFEAGAKSIDKAYDNIVKSATGVEDATERMGLTFDKTANRWRVNGGRFASTAELIEAGLKKSEDAATGAEKSYRRAGISLDKLGDVAKTTGKSFVTLGDNVLSFGASIAKIAAVGIGGVIAGLGAAAFSGLKFNNSMEQVSAKLLAITKDGGKTADILEMIRKRAAETPFAFEDMAEAATALLPAAKAAGVGLEELIAQAEILGASNPAEGLSGAAFSLKEALSGDFTSIVERFNLPRQYINQLKKEGVPALEIVSKAMEQLGLDADLVAGLAGTLEGRWSTFLDTLQTLTGTITQPIFTLFSQGLARVNELLVSNSGFLDNLAMTISGGIQVALDSLISTVTTLFNAFQSGGGAGLVGAMGLTPATVELFSKIGASITDLATIIVSTLFPAFSSFSSGGLLEGINTAIEFLNANFEAFKGAILGVGAALGGAVIAALIAGIGTAIATLATPITAIILASALLGAAWAGNWGGIQEKTFAVWAVIQPILAQLGTWLMTNIPIAIQYLSSLWINTLLPAMTAIWTFVSGTMFPLWLQLQTFLVDVVGFAITNLANQWTNVLIPALTTVWDYISINILPLLVSIGEVINAVVNKAIEASAGLWQNILLPAITAVGEWLNTNLMPTLTAIGEYLTSTFGPMLGDTAIGFDGITTAIQSVTSFLTGFAESIRNFELPWFLTPGSPTPLETGLSGIASILNGPLKGAFATFGVIGANSVKVLSGLLAGEFILSLNTIEEVVTRLFTIWPTLIDAVQLKITAMISLLSQLQSRSGTASSAIISGWSLVNSTIGGVVSKLSTAATSLTTITTNASSATTALKSMSAVVFDTLINRLNTLEEKAGEVESGFEGAVEAADELRSVTFSTMGSALNAINSLIEDIIENFYEMASAANAAESAADGATSGAGNNFAGFGGQAALASVEESNGVSPAVTTPTRGASGNVTNVTMNNNFGGNTLGNNMDLAQFDAMVLRSLQRLMA